MRFIPAVSLVQIQLQPPFGPVVKRPKTPPFHGGNTSSNLVRVTKKRSLHFMCELPFLLFRDSNRTVLPSVTGLSPVTLGKARSFLRTVRESACVSGHGSAPSESRPGHQKSANLAGGLPIFTSSLLTFHSSLQFITDFWKVICNSEQ